MSYAKIINNCFEKNLAKNGLSEAGFLPFLKDAQDAFAKIKKQVESKSYPLFNHLEQDGDLKEIKEHAKAIHEQFDELVVLGTGGSSLNPRAIVDLKQGHYGLDKNVYFIDNVDPHTIDGFINQFDLHNTAFLVTSKSGKTVETIAQFLTFITALDDALIHDKGRHFFVLTDPIDNPIRRIAQQIGATILDHEAEIGGRFSTFTNVGLLPAAFAGIDVAAFRRGAKNALDSVLTGQNNEPIIGAALSMAFMQNGITKTVMMPYVDRLSSFATWYRQIWAESLGKDGKGSTPIKAIGSLDQHSQLQLYLDGPKDKFFNLITLDTVGKGKRIDDEFLDDDELKYLSGKQLGDINAALQEATVSTLIKNNCPVRQIKLSSLNEAVLGGLMMHFILETVITAGLLDLNAFDQPAVEDGKVLARAILRG